MKRKMLGACLSLIVGMVAYGQRSLSSKLNQVTKKELALQVYPADSTARAVVLYEHGNYYVDEKRKFKKTTDYYHKVKILTKEGADKATVSIQLYGDEKVHGIKGSTYNLTQAGQVRKTVLVKDKIYEKQLTSKWREVTFTMPNIKVGSVIEYRYSITSPYSKIDDWYFQSDIPKVKSKFTAAILGNWKYKIRSVGYLPLTTNEVKVRKNCVYMPGLGMGDCVVLKYGIANIPAFEEEKHMLSAENFKSKVAFVLSSFTHADGRVDKYAKTWKHADSRLRRDFLDNQVSKKGFFKRNMPSSILEVENPLTRAEEVYGYIKEHYTWNGKYWPSQKVRIKRAFAEKTGNVFDINLSLFNALKAADIETYLVLSSTRNRAVPTKLHPIINEFNYLLVKVVVDGQVYYLDATEKQLPFGLVQFKAINGDGRVLDFDKGSFWEEITMKKVATESIRAKLDIDASGEVTGVLTRTTKGYKALNKRKELSRVSEEAYLDEFESRYPAIEVDSFKVDNLKEIAKPLKENFKVRISSERNNAAMAINPFLISQRTINPFKLKRRDYPVDFGYARKHFYRLELTAPEGYVFENIPQNMAIKLPNKGGSMVVNVAVQGRVLRLFCKWSIERSAYSSTEYFALKAFFNKLIKKQDVLLKIVPKQKG
ncbi:conserved exported hypothetical protein [Tenacibaculum litopenaei]|uniref:hypothetical protein n=1 Tax=Tenacibaculum litopenaei TaxID=396016 RepID=UPI003894B2F5